MLKMWLVTSKTAQEWTSHQKVQGMVKGLGLCPHPPLNLRGEERAEN